MKTIVRKLLILMLVLAATPALCDINPVASNNKATASHAKKYKRKPLSYFWRRHHYEVQVINDKVTRVRYIETKTKKVKVESFPYGREDSLTSGRIRKFTVSKFRFFMKARAKRLHLSPSMNSARSSKPRVNASAVTYNTGLPFGYNSSTGYLGTSACYNSTTALDNQIDNSGFSSENTSSSTAGQTNVSASVSGSYGAFRASDSFSFANSYDNSANSGDVFFNASVTYTATNVLDTSNPFNSAGSQAQTAGNFSTTCGSQFLTSVPVGMLITGQLNWSTSSSDNSTSISNSLNASYGLDSITSAVTVAYSSSNISNSFGYVQTQEGGGETATSDVNTAYTNGQSYMDSCFNGNTGDCTTFVSDISAGAENAATDFVSELDPVPADISLLTAFPNGVAGVGTTTAVPTTLTSLLDSTYSDALGSYSAALNNYVTILNQIATLNNRTAYLSTALSTPSFNPVPLLDIKGSYVTSLQNTYSSDVSNMMSNLSACLGASNSDASSVCGPVTSTYNNGVTNAWLWYGPSGNNPNNTAQQNTIGLQYTGITTYTGTVSMQFPVDVIWASALPNPWAVNPPSPFNPAGLAGLVAFADAPYYWNGAMTSGASHYTQLQRRHVTY